MYRIKRNDTPTKEEKVAQKISTLVSDFSLDLEAVGYYMATAIPYVPYSRALEILESYIWWWCAPVEGNKLRLTAYF